MIVMVTGLPGTGKTTIGKMLAKKLGWQFYDMDDHLPSEAKKFNIRGEFVPEDIIDDYIETMIKDITQLHTNSNVVASCVLAKPEYIEMIKNIYPETLFLHLKASLNTLIKRLEIRKGHFFNVELLRKSYDGKWDIETPGTKIDANQSVENVLGECLKAIE